MLSESITPALPNLLISLLISLNFLFFNPSFSKFPDKAENKKKTG